MNFLTCDGTWSIDAAGGIVCSGNLVTYTSQEVRDIISPGLTIEEAVALRDEALVLFAVVFGILVIKKAF